MSKRKRFLVSLLKSMYDTCPESISMDTIFQYLILETFRSDTEKHRYYRSVGMKKEAQRIKEMMMNFVPSVLLSGGKSEGNAVEYTSLGFADFDHVPPTDLQRCLALLNADPYVVLSYITISGEGIRVIYLTDITDARYHADVYSQGNRYYSALLGYPYDEQCSNLARTSILCYCPQAIYHPEAQPLHIEPTPIREEKRKKGRPKKTYRATITEVEEAVLRQLEQDGKSYTEGHYNEYLSAALYLMNRYGVDEQDACDWATGRFTDYEASKVKSIAHSIFQHADQHGTQKLPSEKGKTFSYVPLPEVEKFISTQAQVRNNLVSEKREICFEGEEQFRDLSDRDENTLWLRANKAHAYCAPKTIQLILNSEYVPNFNPFTDYLFGLNSWDGKTDFIRQLSDTVKTTEPDLFAVYFKKWFVAMVASLIDPVIVNNEVLVFIGEQGVYKTTWMNRLLPPEWRQYFYTKTNNQHMTKDDRLTLAECALLCMEEIDHMTSAEMNQLKGMVSIPAINERSFYARNKVHRPHFASFCGTGNNYNFLNDPSGTRRWLTFEVISIDDPYTMTLPYREIYAQAVALFRSGFKYWFEPEELDALKQNNEQFELPSMEQELVLMYYRNPCPGERPVFVSTAEIMQRINSLIKNPLSVSTLSAVMRKNGFKSSRSGNIRGYHVMELSPEEISRRKHQS